MVTFSDRQSRRLQYPSGYLKFTYFKQFDSLLKFPNLLVFVHRHLQIELTGVVAQFVMKPTLRKVLYNVNSLVKKTLATRNQQQNHAYQSLPL